MYEPLTRTVFLPLHEALRGRHTMAYYRELKDARRLDADEIRQARNKKLLALLKHCYRNVLHYRQAFDHAGIGEPGTSEDLAALAALEREDVRRNPEALKANGYEDRLIPYNTGGSTGAPLVFYTDKVKEARHNAYKLHCRSWYGVMPGERQVDFWGSPIELNNQTRLRMTKDRYFLNQVLLSAFDLTEQRLSEYAAFIGHYRPRLIYGYPTVIYRIARYMEETGLKPDLSPRVVVCTSEMLYPQQREAIGRVFGCPVANEYGARDAGLIAHECPHGRLHLAAGHVHVEVDRPDAEGVGDLLITNLDGYGFPLLRYRVGDRGRLSGEACDCGLLLPVLGELSGRSNDFLVGNEGKLIHSLGAIYILREIQGIRQFKIVQHPDRRLEIMVVGEPLSETTQRSIQDRMAKLLGFDVRVEIHMVEVIPPEKSGKYRWVISHALGARR